MVTHLKTVIRQWWYNRQFKRFVRNQLKEMDEKLDAELDDIQATVSALEMDFIFSPDDEEDEDREGPTPRAIAPPSPPPILGIGMSAYNAFGPLFAWLHGTARDP